MQRVAHILSEKVSREITEAECDEIPDGVTEEMFEEACGQASRELMTFLRTRR